MYVVNKLPKFVKIPIKAIINNIINNSTANNKCYAHKKGKLITFLYYYLLH